MESDKPCNMKKTNRIVIGVLLVLAPIIFAFVYLPKDYFSPEPDCKPQKNPILKTEEFNSAGYQQEVIRLLELKNPEDFRYFFKTFLQKEETDFIVVNFRNQEYCFDVIMKVTNWDKLEGMKKTNGSSYPKELHELEWTIEEQNGNRELVYKNMHKIID